MIETGTTYNEDCMATMGRMPNDSVDIIVTSPPYNLNKRASGGGSSKRDYSGWYPDDMPEEEYQQWQVQVVAEAMRVCRGSVFYNHRVRYAWHSRNKYKTPSRIYHPMQWLWQFPIWCEIIWDRCGTTGHANKRCRMSDERIYQIGKPHTFHDMGYRTVWSIPPSRNAGHVCSFPDELVRRCILMASDPGDVVYDPFMGSGTTARVATELGRRFVGSEIDAEYHDMCRGSA
jgi:DNA modification methylase